MVRVIKMISRMALRDHLSLYDQRKVKLPTQSAKNWFSMGKWAIPNSENIFSGFRKASDDQIFQEVCMLSVPFLKKGFAIFAKMIII